MDILKQDGLLTPLSLSLRIEIEAFTAVGNEMWSCPRRHRASGEPRAVCQPTNMKGEEEVFFEVPFLPFFSHACMSICLSHSLSAAPLVSQSAKHGH